MDKFFNLIIFMTIRTLYKKVYSLRLIFEELILKVFDLKNKSS